MRKSLVFKPSADADAPPPKKKARKVKKSKAKTRAARKKPAPKTAANSKPAVVDDLDSVLLQWKRKVPALRGLSASEAASILDKEANHFESLSRAQVKALAQSIRNALVELAPSLQAANDFAVEKDAQVLRLEWVNKLKEEVHKLRSKRAATSATTFTPASFVGSFIESRKKTPVQPGQVSHPRGDANEAENGEYVVSSSSSEDDSGVSSAFEQSDDEVAASSKTKPNEQPKTSDEPTASMSSNDPSLANPLSMTSEHRAELKAMQKVKGPAKLQSRTANWIADTFCHGAPFVADLVSGDNPWPEFSRTELKSVCVKISQLFDKVDLRERVADGLAKEAQEALLKSELKLFTDIRMHLLLIRLGPKGGGRFREKIADEDTRQDFKSTYNRPKAFKLYMKELESVNAASAARKSKRGEDTSTAKSKPAAPKRRRRQQQQPRRRQYNPRFGNRQRRYGNVPYNNSPGRFNRANANHRSRNSAPRQEKRRSRF